MLILWYLGLKLQSGFNPLPRLHLLVRVTQLGNTGNSLVRIIYECWLIMNTDCVLQGRHPLVWLGLNAQT